MWCDHPFAQRNKTTERAEGLEVGEDMGGGGGWTKFEKGGGNIGGLHNIRGLGPLCQLCFSG